MSSLGIPSAGAVSAVGGDSSVDSMKAVLARADASARPDASGKPGTTASLSYVVTENRLSIILTSAQGAIAAQQPLDQRGAGETDCLVQTGPGQSAY